MLSTANTMTASFTLSQEQIAYLISVNHPNIQQHFFASFLTRDHALQLLDGILKQKHGRDGFTSLSSPSPLPTPAVSSTNSPASQTRSISRDNTAGAEKDNKGKTKKALPTAQPVASSVADTATATTTATGTTADDQYSMLLPASASQELPTSLSFSTPSHHSTVVHSQLPSSQSVDSVSTFHQSSSRASATAADSPSTAVPHSPAAVDDASQTDGGDEWASADEAPASIADTLDFGTADMQPPLGDFNDADDALLLDTTFALDPLLFFHLFYADLAPFSLHSYHAQRATDSEFKMTRWRDIVEEPSMAAAAASQSEAKRREVEGDLLRRLSYRMQFVTPVGPPITRVHRVQRWYVLNKQQQQPSGARLDSCSVTPDIMFGDQVVILERMYVEQLPSEQSTATAEGTDGEQQQQPQVRVRVFGGVRFKSRPWKMKPFIGLIQQRSREDVKAGVEQWEQFVKRKMLEEPEKVEACKKRVAALRVRSGVEQLIPKGQPNHSWKRATTLPVGPRTQSSQPSASHEASTSTSTSGLVGPLPFVQQPPHCTAVSHVPLSHHRRISHSFRCGVSPVGGASDTCQPLAVCALDGVASFDDSLHEWRCRLWWSCPIPADSTRLLAVGSAHSASLAAVRLELAGHRADGCRQCGFVADGQAAARRVGLLQCGAAGRSAARTHQPTVRCLLPPICRPRLCQRLLPAARPQCRAGRGAAAAPHGAAAADGGQARAGEKRRRAEGIVHQRQETRLATSAASPQHYK